ncbi:FAD-binding oxidoreductase [Pseudonocardia sp. DSM 110487]|uniref:FAD-binding and (Fe-S)-binding domain-containing protein n=1 Tax=Pseudonocardia sp. DSM 110487 TaxID=2865833 RepID=UPI001C696171|nr:FAD-binding and (Fe-S)-binding domain-containing protein [Pseudonocardia sp. DSM 110487]QYN32998.1 FAD-binding oxidoreductase [Pseudonocardia sp. DSM 110487]
MSIHTGTPEIASLLRRAGVEVADDEGTRARYSSDASLYRIPPRAVVLPRHADEVEAVLDLCRGAGVPVTARGAGTSVAGNAVGPGVILDFSRYMNRVLDVDPEAGTAVVQPGVVQAELQRAAAPHGLRFGPDPSTHTRCTIGGMIGNNACGARSLGYGRTSDNVVGLRAVTGGGDALRTGRDGAGRPIAHGADGLTDRLHATMAGNLAIARTEFDRFGRQVSGYAVQHLLPERFDLTAALVGSEGTLAVVTEATVRLVGDPAYRTLVVLGFDDIVAAGTAAPAVVAHGPTACEGLDSRLVDVIRARRGPSRIPDLPAGRAWLFVELAGDDRSSVLDRADALIRDIGAVDAVVVDDPEPAGRLWRIREDGAGLAGTAPSGRPAWPGWEDAAVPPAALGEYLTGFDELVDEHGLSCAPYGHFGEGCIHVRLDFPFGERGGSAAFGAFLKDAATLVARCGGTLSGEHGDGRARSELLPLMYSERAIRLFAAVKHAFDPDGLLNPGVLVDPDPATAAVRVDGAFAVRSTGFPLIHDDGDLARAVHRCTGVGKCRADNSGTGGVMCPSYLATRDEKDTTRGRARVLQELIRGDRPDWRAPEVHEALDLCLSCKGCTSDCPTGIDMPTYKSEVLHRAYRGRLRPRSHYSLGRLPRWARMVGRAAPLANGLLAVPGLRRAALWLAGVDERRSIPRFARTPFRRHPSRRREAVGGRPVLLFVDSFSDNFSPAVAEAAAAVLVDAGFSPRYVEHTVCCGLTWITTGQLDAARRILGRTVEELARHVAAGTPIVGLEPSCTAVLRQDAVDLLDSADARAVAANTWTLAELLADQPGWTPPDLTGTTVVAQPHCHQHAVMGWTADRDLLVRAGAAVHAVAGCCGLAGNFGVERGHYEVSVAVAGLNLLPALDADTDAVVLADGFSCRTQIDDLRSRPSMHLAQLLAAALPARRGVSAR